MSRLALRRPATGLILMALLLTGCATVTRPTDGSTVTCRTGAARPVGFQSKSLAHTDWLDPLNVALTGLLALSELNRPGFPGGSNP